MRVRSLRRIAVGTLIGWVAVVLAPILLPHGRALDLLCSEERWSTNSSVVAIWGDASPDSGGHCVVCHLQRAAREAVADSPRSALLVQHAEPGTVPVERAPASGLSVQLPARAPPAPIL